MALGFTNIVYYLQGYGILDFLLPFLLVFTIMYAVLQRVELFKEKSMQITIAVIMGILFVVPHLTGSYPVGYDPVQIVNSSLPSISLVAIAIVMSLLLMGIVGKKYSEKATPWIAVVAIALVGYIFMDSLNFFSGMGFSLYNWVDPELVELTIIVLIFGLIVKFITGSSGGGDGLKKAGKAVKEGVENLTENA